MRPTQGEVEGSARGVSTWGVSAGGWCLSRGCLGRPPTQQTDTATDGTHPTAMHSCVNICSHTYIDIFPTPILFVDTLNTA